MLSRHGESPFWRRTEQYPGLVYAYDGQPDRLGRLRSRQDHGPFVSPQLDADIEDLQARLGGLERRFRALPRPLT